MDPDHGDENLSKIHTMWTALRQARGGPARAVRDAQLCLLERYSRPIHRYLRGALRDPDAAQDVFQEFVVRFLSGGFDRADPERGRFRHFLKTALARMVVDCQRERKWRPQRLTTDLPDPAPPEEQAAELDREFLAASRAQLLADAWEALARHDQRTGEPLSLVLRCHADHPTVPAHELAKLLGAAKGKTVSPEWVRKWRARAREEFGDLFLEVVTRSLGDADLEAVERELLDLGLLHVCRFALERRRESVLS